MMCQEHFEGRTIFEGRRGPEISSGKENKPIWKVSIKKKNANPYPKPLHVGLSQAWHTNLSITHSFFELQTPDFA